MTDYEVNIKAIMEQREAIDRIIEKLDELKKDCEELKTNIDITGYNPPSLNQSADK